MSGMLPSCFVKLFGLQAAMRLFQRVRIRPVSCQVGVLPTREERTHADQRLSHGMVTLAPQQFEERKFALSASTRRDAPTPQAIRVIVRPLQEFLQTETAGGFVLLGAAIAALIWINAPFGHTYHEFWGGTSSWTSMCSCSICHSSSG